MSDSFGSTVLAAGTMHWEPSLSASDPISNGLYILVVSVVAPLWEEVIFRGFLLPSLSRYFPVSQCVCISAVVFALAHFSYERLLPLVCLGILMGIMYVRTRNLLTPILLHSLWNLYAFCELCGFG